MKTLILGFLSAICVMPLAAQPFENFAEQFSTPPHRSDSMSGIELKARSLSFTANDGQMAGDQSRSVRYYVRSRTALCALRTGGMSHVLFATDSSDTVPARGHSEAHRTNARAVRVDVDFIGSNVASIVAEDPLVGYENYYSATQPSGVTSVRNYRTIRYVDLYENIDVVFRAMPNGIKYNFIVHPGGDPGAITMRYSGQKSMDVHDRIWL